MKQNFVASAGNRNEVHERNEFSRPDKYNLTFYLRILFYILSAGGFTSGTRFWYCKIAHSLQQFNNCFSFICIVGK